MSPSAACLVILDHDYKINQTLAGFSETFFKNGMLVYIGNMVHFASIHSEKLYQYNPVTHNSRQIYPLKNDPFRDAYGVRLEKVMDKKWCAQINSSCEPEDFTTNIHLPIEVNDQTNAMAFEIDFEPEGFLPREETESSGKWKDDRYVYIYRFNPLRWREFSFYDLKPRFGASSLQELLTPQKLQQIFSAPSDQ